MTAKPDDIAGLVERVRAATAPDRGLDYEIEKLGRAGQMLLEHGYVRLEGDNGYYSSTPPFVGAEKVAPAQPYTDSIDSALYIAQELLPGWQINLSTFGGFAEASVGARGAFPAHQAPSPALALILATLIALSTKGPSHE